ncbi:MAG: hypothetical protein ACREBU_05725 [Nitrososphaera sp.]
MIIHALVSLVSVALGVWSLLWDGLGAVNGFLDWVLESKTHTSVFLLGLLMAFEIILIVFYYLSL